MRAVAVILGVVAGLVIGAGAMLAANREVPPVAQPSPTPATTAPAPKAMPPPQTRDEVLLVWSAGGLPAGVAGAIGRLPAVTATTVVRGSVAELVRSTDAAGRVIDALSDGHVIPLDAVAIQPRSMAAFVPKSAAEQLTALRPGQAVLSTTGAALRDLPDGGLLTLTNGEVLEVVGVVDDAFVGAAEVAVTVATGARIGVTAQRYVLVRHRGERAAVEQQIRAIAPDVTFRIRGPGETPVFRHGDAVLPQAAIKERFGEFSYRPAAGRDVQQDAAWVRENIVTADVPILGTVRCHRSIIPALEGALAELADANLAWLVQPEDYAGCHASRLTSSQQSVSRHAWGVAFDLNFSKNPVGQSGNQDRRLVDVMKRWGFTWGGEWLVPDPAHFEYLGPPATGS